MSLQKSNSLQEYSPLHEKKYVHGDIRLESIVFHNENVWLIDFDLTRKVDTNYPSGYVDKFS